MCFCLLWCLSWNFCGQYSPLSWRFQHRRCTGYGKNSCWGPWMKEEDRWTHSQQTSWVEHTFTSSSITNKNILQRRQPYPSRYRGCTMSILTTILHRSTILFWRIGHSQSSAAWVTSALSMNSEFYSMLLTLVLPLFRNLWIVKIVLKG